MVEKHAVDDSIELVNGIDEPNKRARHEDGESNLDIAPVTEEQNHVEQQDPRMIPRIGGWNLDKETPEVETIPLDFDVNGDPQETEAKVWEILRKGSGKESQDMAKNASQASAPDRILSRRSHTGTPVANTPPPPTRRSRRSAAQREQQVSEVPTTIEELSQARVEDVHAEDIQPASASIDLITLFDQDLTVAIPALTQLVDTAASIPGFLKSEVTRLLQVKSQDSQEANASGSETQDDGYLKTKSQWAFELGKVINDKVENGPEIVESDDEADRLIMMVRLASSETEGYGYSLERATRQRANELRSDVRTNPWFNAQGQPFSVIYRMPMHLSVDHSSGHTSFATQQASQEKSIVQQREMDELREERDRLINQLAANMEDLKSVKEQSTLLKQLYDDASRSNMESEIESERLNAENAQLKTQLSEGMASVRSFAKARVSDLEQKVGHLNGQLHLLKEQNRLTGDEIRRKAALWDAAEAREQERQAELARRQAKRDKERRALQEQILGSESSNEPLKKPHEIFLEVDLEKEKIDVDAKREQENIEKLEKAQQTEVAVVDDDDDELAALQREAAEFGALDTLLDEGDRSRRSRRQRKTPAIPQEGPAKEDLFQTNEELAEAISHNQDQALLSASNELEDQLGFVDQSANDFFTSNEDQQGLSHVQ